jgi:hypothetical protein
VEVTAWRAAFQIGTIVLECDLDLPPETAYKAYDSRWEIEIVMRYSPEKPPKKKPCRPKGSKKKKEEVVAIEPTKRKRGRPKGGRNKPKPQPDTPKNSFEM